MTLNNQEFPNIHNSLSISEENLTPNEEGIINTPMKISIFFSPIRLMNNRRKSKSISKINIRKEQKNEKDKNKNNIKHKDNCCIKGNTNISNEIIVVLKVIQIFLMKFNIKNKNKLMTMKVKIKII